MEVGGKMGARDLWGTRLMQRSPPEFFKGATISVRHLNRWMEFLFSMRPIDTPTVKVQEWTGAGIKLRAEVGPSAEGWTGNCWIAGSLYSGFNATSSPWSRIDLTQAVILEPVITEEDGPPPSPWGQGIIWRKKVDQTTIYIDRLG